MKKTDRESAEYFLGQRIAVLRENARMTQEQLAEESQLTRAYIGRIELGIACPSIRTLMKISSGLGLGGVSYFFVPKTNQEIERDLTRFDFRQ